MCRYEVGRNSHMITVKSLMFFLCNHFSPECLEPFASILLQHENTVLNKDTVIERTRARIVQVLSQINEHFYVANDVGKKLITLEVLKEKFEPYKGHSWYVADNMLKIHF